MRRLRYIKFDTTLSFDGRKIYEFKLFKPIKEAKGSSYDCTMKNITTIFAVEDTVTIDRRARSVRWKSGLLDVSRPQQRIVGGEFRQIKPAKVWAVNTLFSHVAVKIRDEQRHHRLQGLSEDINKIFGK